MFSEIPIVLSRSKAIAIGAFNLSFIDAYTLLLCKGVNSWISSSLKQIGVALC